ncbi:MAG: hypothetical protein ABR975_11280 [Vulcanimicrobiaceae bacterium]|jgi:hypothetical protein
MRARVKSIAAACVLALLLPACAGGSHAATATASPRPAPTDPDLGSMMENYYQQIEGEHWAFAYAMLSPRYKKQLSQDAFIDCYRSIVAPDVRVQQRTDRTLDVELQGRDASVPTKHIDEVEHVRVVWDGQEWLIDDIQRSAI